MRKLIMIRLYFTLFLLLAGVLGVHGQNKIKWLTWEEAMVKSEANPKKIFIDFYTEWCGWCKKLDASTLSKDYIATYINDNFYAVKFDAQYKNPITYQGVEYKYVKTVNGNYHELVAMLLKGSLKFPSIMFLDENRQTIQIIQNYLDASTMEQALNYYGTDSYKTTPWRKYVRSFIPSEQYNISVNSGSR